MELEKRMALLRRLERPEGQVDVVLDTDAFNEVDDQFALAYLLCSKDRFQVKAIYAAPFHNARSTGPADGMEKSYQEILRLLRLMGDEGKTALVHRGSCSYLRGEEEPVHSAAAKDLAKRAMQYTPERPLYVIAIGAITNVASALLIAPEIAERMVLVWLAGHAWDWSDQREFNLYQDIAGARVVYSTKIALVQLPCRGVVSALTISKPELEYWLRGKNALCDDLIEAAIAAGEAGGKAVWTRIIWDVAAIAWFMGEDYVHDRTVPMPIAQYDHLFAFRPDGLPMKYVYYVNRDAIVADLFLELSGIKA